MPAYRVSKFFDQIIAPFLYLMDPQPDKWIFCENNSPDDTIYRLAQFKRPHEVLRFWVRRDARHLLETEYDVIGIARQLLLQRARQLDPDWAVFIDADIQVVTPNLLDMLTSHDDADIVGGPYLRWYSNPSSPNIPNLLLACNWPLPDDSAIRSFAQFLAGPKMKWDTGLLSVGGGCMALPRRVLQDRRLNFYPVLHPEIGPCSEDYGYCVAAKKLGYVIGLDASARVMHPTITLDLFYDKPWMVDENGKTPTFEYPA